MADEPKVPEESGETPKPTPPPPPVTPVEPKSDFEVPEKFKGKSAEEIAKSYVELEKKLNEPKTDEEKQNALNELKYWRELGTFIENDPEAIKTLENSIKRQRGIADTPAPQEDDTKIALRDDKISAFEKQFGIDSLPAEKKADLHKRIGNQVALLVDPTGKTTYIDAVKNIPVSQLNNYLSMAYKVATVDDAEERGRTKALIEARQNKEGTMESMPSTSGNTDTINLTPEQRAVAQKLGIPEEKYKEQLKKLTSN
jgi:hypothetical protein